MLIIVILLNVIAVTDVNAGWHQLDDLEYYIEYNAVLGVDKAKEGCAARNATLANVKTQKIQDFLVTKIENLTDWPYSFYIGLKRNISGYYWSDGILTYTNWAQEHNTNYYGKSCVSMGLSWKLDPDFQWYFEYCTSPCRYICQRTRDNGIMYNSTMTYVLIGVGIGAILICVISGIVYVKCRRGNSKSLGIPQHNHNDVKQSMEAETHHNILYGTSNNVGATNASPDLRLELCNEYDVASPVYSCVDALPSRAASDVQPHAVYDIAEENPTMEEH